MKNFLLAIFGIFLTINCFSAEWEDHWIKAMECEMNDSNLAENEFNLSIIALEKSEDCEENFYVYIDLARFYMSQNRYEEALTNLDKVLSSDLLTKSDRIRALVSRISTYVNLGEEDKAFEDYQEFRTLYDDFPKIKFNDSKIIIRNVPDCDCAHSIMKNYLVNGGLCNDETDIQIINPGIWVVKRKIPDCNCNRKNVPPPSKKREDDCKYWCDKLAFTSNLWCGRVFKEQRCQIICLVAVELIRDTCHLCCRGGDFYNNCVKPFEDILGMMGGNCNPDWNAK